MYLKRIAVIAFLVVTLTACKKEDASTRVFEMKQTAKEALQAGTEFIFKERNVEKVAEEVQPTTNFKNIPLYLGNNYYYKVELPVDTEIVTDYSKYIYGVDDSVSVQILKGVTKENFAKLVAIDKAEAVSPTMLMTKPGLKAPQEAACLLINDLAIVIRCYDNPQAYANIVNGLKNNTVENLGAVSLVVSDKTETLVQPPLYEDYPFTMKVGLGDDPSKTFYYEHGSLVLSREIKEFDDAVDELSRKAIVANGHKVDIDKIYNSEFVTYIEIGDVTFCAITENLNTTITLFGTGNEAKCNIAAYVMVIAK